MATHDLKQTHSYQSDSLNEKQNKTDNQYRPFHRYFLKKNISISFYSIHSSLVEHVLIGAYLLKLF